MKLYGSGIAIEEQYKVGGDDPISSSSIKKKEGSSSKKVKTSSKADPNQTCKLYPFCPNKGHSRTSHGECIMKRVVDGKEKEAKDLFAAIFAKQESKFVNPRSESSRQKVHEIFGQDYLENVFDKVAEGWKK